MWWVYGDVQQPATQLQFRNSKHVYISFDSYNPVERVLANQREVGRVTPPLVQLHGFDCLELAMGRGIQLSCFVHNYRPAWGSI